MTTADTQAAELPGSAWALGWAFLGAQLLTLARRGFTDSEAPWPLLSMVLSAVVVGWFAAGVLRARPLRTGFVWLILGIGLLLEVFSVIAEPGGPGGWVELLVSAIPVILLSVFCNSPYYAEQRRLDAEAALVRPAIGGVLALAVITGALGGITAQVSGHGDQIHVGL